MHGLASICSVKASGANPRYQVSAYVKTADGGLTVADFKRMALG